MPVYVYRCPVCGTTEDHLRRIADRNELLPCPVCPISYREDGQVEAYAQAMERDITAEGGHTDTGYQTPILSEALGVNPSQIDEAKQRFPHHNFHPDGRLILTSHGERKQVMKDLGFRDWDGFTG